MKKVKILLLLTIFLSAGWAFSPQILHADMEWKVLKNINLKATPLDIALSADGQYLFILTPGEVVVFSTQEAKISDRIPVGKEFDRISTFPMINALTITSSKKKSLQIINFEAIYKIDLTGSPFKGPQEAPVIVAVFTDYQ